MEQRKESISKRGCAVIYSAISYLVIMLVFSGYAEFRIVWHLFILLVFFGVFTSFVGVGKKIFSQHSILLTIFLLTAIIVLGIISSGVVTYLPSNIRSMLYPLCAAFLFLIIIEKNQGYVLYLFDHYFCFFNIVLLINTIVLALQSKGTGFMIKDSWLEQNPYYDDQCAGLFGFNATNVLGLFVITVMMYNLMYCNCKVKSRGRKYVIYVYTFIMVAIQAYLSKYNDNIGYYILLVMFFGLYLLYDLVYILKTPPKVLKRIGVYLLLFLVGVSSLIRTAFFQNYIARVFKNRVEVMFKYQTVEMTGSNERLHIVRNALEHDWGWGIGKGLGVSKLVQGGFMGFPHFGLSSVGAYITLGGLWFYLLFTLLYTIIFYKIVNVRKKTNKKLLILIYAVMVVFSFYTNIYSDARSVIMLAILAVLFRKMNLKFIGSEAGKVNDGK